jgi:hypothetical protein
VYAVRVSHRRLRRRAEKVRRHVASPRDESRVVVREVEYVERLAYTRSQAAEVLGVSRSTFIRRVLPYVETIETAWGARLIPVDALERLLAERRRAARSPIDRASPGRPPGVPPEMVERIRADHAAVRASAGSPRS